MTIVRLGGAINASGINMDTGAGNLLVYVSSGELYALDGNGDRVWVQTLVGSAIRGRGLSRCWRTGGPC